MNKKIPGFYFFLFVAVFSLFTFSCTRINNATELGDDLVPAVDNVNTFDTLIDVQTFNDTFTLASADKLLTDSARMFKSGVHFLGRIDNDPLFGKTEASIFMELKPSFYKYFFEHAKDSLIADSAVLVLDYSESFGDTNALQTVNVYEIDNIASNLFKIDSNYLIRKNGFTKSNLLGTKTFAPNILNDSVKTFLDTTKNQLRIRLNQGPGAEYIATKFIKTFDSTGGAYSSDSAFRSQFKGFAIEPASSGNFGNAIMGFNLLGGKTKLALYYKFKRSGVYIDTVKYFTFNTASGNANYIKRDYSGFPASTAFGGGSSPDDLVYLQNTPGTFARIKIPGLDTVSNRVVHRAELIVEQIYHSSDGFFYRPEQLFVDVLDTALKNYRYIPFDFLLDQTGTPNLNSIGTSGKKTQDGAGNPIQVWKFTLSRYVQNVLTKREASHDLRLFAPFIVNDIYKPNPGVTGFFNPLGINSAIARGRVRVAGGNYSVEPARRMRLRIVYSKL